MPITDLQDLGQIGTVYLICERFCQFKTYKGYMNIPRRVSVILYTALSFWLCGCSTNNFHGTVYRQWSSHMSEMGIFPVYPPREDIVVGDALISEVYFARSMNLAIERKTATGASASARPISTGELKSLKDMGLLATRTKTNVTTSTSTTNSGTSTNVFIGTKANMIDVTDGDTAYDLARKLRNLNTPDGVDNVGGSVKVLSASASSIGLRRTFERPICMGVRGVLIKLEVNHPADLNRNCKKEWMKVVSFGH